MRQDFAHPLLFLRGRGKIAEFGKNLRVIAMEIHVVRSPTQRISIQSPSAFLRLCIHLCAELFQPGHVTPSASSIVYLSRKWRFGHPAEVGLPNAMSIPDGNCQ